MFPNLCSWPFLVSSLLRLTQSLELNISQTCWEANSFQVAAGLVQRIVWGEPTCSPFVLFRNIGHDNGFFFLLQLPTSLASGWVKAAACHRPIFPPSFPPLLHKLHPMLSSQTPSLCPGGCRQPLLRWVHLLGCPLFSLLLNYANFLKPPQRNFLGISLSPPATPSAPHCLSNK